MFSEDGLPSSVSTFGCDMRARSKDLRELTSDERKKFREKYDVFFFDKDGTLSIVSSGPIPGVTATLTTLANLGKHLYLFTDNCLRTREYITKAVQDEFPQFKKENVICSGWLLIKHLKDIGFNKKIYAIGEPNGIIKELKDAGYEVESDGVCSNLTYADIPKVKLDPQVGAVVMCVDLNYSYLKLFKAVNYLRNPESQLFITHLPLTWSSQPLTPAAGAMFLPMVEISKKECTCCGKSSPASVDYIQSLGYDMSRCLFVGDILESDVACGNMCGMDTLLVLSGVSSLEDVERARERGDHHLIPTYVGGSVADLGDIFSRV